MAWLAPGLENHSRQTCGSTAPDDDPEIKAIAHWNADPKPSSSLPVPRAGSLWKYDPDADTMTDEPWVSDCLFAATYPPPEVSRANSSPQK